MGWEREREVAIEAVAKASRLCRGVQRRLVEGHTLAKEDRSPVTVADFGAQAVVSHLLASAFPDDPLVGEEDAGALRSGAPELAREVVDHVRRELPSLDAAAVFDAIDRGAAPGGPRGRHWTLDPIDGTKGFLRIEQYAVALALVQDGEVVLGVLGCPHLPLGADPEGERGALFVATRGEGAWQMRLDGRDARRIGVDRITDPALAAFCESVEEAHSSRSHAARVAEILGITRPPYRIDSQCKYAAVARGDASIYLRLPTRPGYTEKIWDHAAGARIVLEAGGRVTDVDGRSLDFGAGRTLAHNAGRGVVVTNGALHERVIEAVQRALSEE